jgi:hypothetical protein
VIAKVQLHSEIVHQTDVENSNHGLLLEILLPNIQDYGASGMFSPWPSLPGLL